MMLFFDTTWIGTVLVVTGYVGLLAWAIWCHEENETGWRDLRVWVAVLVVIQVWLYVSF